MKQWFSPLKNTRYLAKTGVLTALLFAVGLTTAFFKFGDSAFQFADGLYFALICLISGPMMLVVGILYPIFFDLVNGGFVFIPISILIHCSMFGIIKLLKKPLTGYGAILIGGLMIFGYVLYAYLINLNLGIEVAKAVGIRELIVDAIQYGVSLFVGCVLFGALSRVNISKIF